MNDSGSNNEIEDVLASIRRLVSKDTTPPPAAPESPRDDIAPAADDPAGDENEFLVLTPSQRISRRVAEVVAARDAATAAGTGPRDLANELARLESSIAELEAVVSPAAAMAVPPEAEEAPFIEMTDDDLVEERPPAVTLAFRSSYASPEQPDAPVPDEAQAAPQEVVAGPAPDLTTQDEGAADALLSEPDEIVDNAPEQGPEPLHAALPLPDEAFAAPEPAPEDALLAEEPAPEEEAAGATEPEAADTNRDEEDDPAGMKTPADRPDDVVNSPEAEEDEDRETGLLADAPEATPAPAEAPMRPTIVRSGAVALDDAGPAEDDDDPDDEAVAPAAAEIDEDALRLMVAQLIREELRGVLGERITSNVRKLVRREIQRALRDQTLD